MDKNVLISYKNGTIEKLLKHSLSLMCEDKVECDFIYFQSDPKVPINLLIYCVSGEASWEETTWYSLST